MKTYSVYMQAIDEDIMTIKAKNKKEAKKKALRFMDAHPDYWGFEITEIEEE